MTKPELRKRYLQKRLAIHEPEYLHMNRILCDLFFITFDLSFIKVVHTFLPLREKKEPDTWLIIDRLRREFPHIRLSMPKIKNGSEVENIFFEGIHQLQKNTWGIEEPRHGVPTETDQIDLVIVPLLCFDRQGNRVGYGKGFYDKLLSNCRPDCKKIGLSFFDPVEFITDVNELDQPLDFVITPATVFSF